MNNSRKFLLSCLLLCSFNTFSDVNARINVIPEKDVITTNSTAKYSDDGMIVASPADPETEIMPLADFMAPDNKKLAYGEGIDTARGISTGEICVTFANKKDPKPQKNISTIRRFEFISEQNGVSDYSQVSLGAAFPVNGIPIDLSFGEKSASFKSRFASHIVVESTAYTEYSSKKNDQPRLNSKGISLLKQGYGIFRLKCGDEFVIGKSFGGYLKGIFSYEATSMSSQQSMGAALKVGVKEVGANAGLSEGSQNAFASVTDKESLIIIGTKASPKSNKLIDVYQFYNDFQKTVFDNKDSRELMYETVDYLSLIIQAKKEIASTGLDPELAKAMSRLQERIQYRSDLLYASKNWVDFLPISNEYVMKLQSQLNKEIESIRVWGVKCLLKTFQVKKESETCGNFDKEVQLLDLQPIIPSNRPSIVFPREVFASSCEKYQNIAIPSPTVRILRISGNFVCHRWNCTAEAAQNMNIRIRDTAGNSIIRRYIGPTKIPANYFADAHTTDCPGDWWTDNEPGDAVYDLAPAMFPDDPFTNYF